MTDHDQKITDGSMLSPIDLLLIAGSRAGKGRSMIVLESEDPATSPPEGQDDPAR